MTFLLGGVAVVSVGLLVFVGARVFDADLPSFVSAADPAAVHTGAREAASPEAARETELAAARAAEATSLRTRLDGSSTQSEAGLDATDVHDRAERSGDTSSQLGGADSQGLVGLKDGRGHGEGSDPSLIVQSDSTQADAESGAPSSRSESDGFRIADVPEGTSAWDAGLRPGDQVLAANGQPIPDWKDIVDVVNSPDFEPPVVLTYKRPDGSVGTAELSPPHYCCLISDGSSKK